jgi:hypothetical protein
MSWSSRITSLVLRKMVVLDLFGPFLQCQINSAKLVGAEVLDGPRPCRTDLGQNRLSLIADASGLTRLRQFLVRRN